MVIKLLSSIPKGVEADLSAPDGIRLISWATHENKYTIQIWAKGKLGPYEVWRRKVLRARFIGGPGRPTWSKISVHGIWPEALEAGIEARNACLFGGEPRAFTINYLHEKLEKMVFNRKERQ